MSIKKINKNPIFALVFIISIIFYCKIVFATAPNFEDLATIMNLTEDVEFVYIVNATDLEGNYPLVFSDDSETKLPVFNMAAFNTSDNNRRAVINFTPTENDVLDANKDKSNYIITIIIYDNRSEGPTAQGVLINITNVNDPPNITSFTPASMVVEENSTITFSFDNNTADPDLIHPGADSINNVWYLNGTNSSTNVSWAYTPGFCNSSVYNVTLVVNDSYKNSTSISRLLTVTNLNRPPVNNATIGNLTWQEDNNLTNNFTLAGYFNDTDMAECSGSNRDTLIYGYISYGVSNSINSSKSVNVSIDQSTGNVSFYVPANWYGVEIIAFYANDSYNITYSNNITLNVTNVNDAPVLAQINNQTLKVGTLFTMQVNATDPDNDTLYFYTNSSIINISLTTGIINFTPAEAHIGDHIVNITVNDSLLTDYRIVNFSITNNTPAVLNPIGNQNATKGVLFELNLTAIDADGDNLTFASNSTMFSIIWYNKSMSQISFTPSSSDVGNHSIKFNVTDPAGAFDSEVINFTINDSNRAPVLNFSINNITWRHDTNLTNNITLSDYFHDPDGDNLTYNVTGNVNITIVINQTTTNVSFYPAPGWFGVEYIRFYANDSYYVTYSNNITLNVTPNNAPLIHNIYPYGNWASIIYDWTNASLYPDGTNISVSENTTVEFKQNSSDADGDNLTYQWLLNGSLVNTTQNLTFYFNFTTAGVRNLTVTISDGINTTSFHWNINVTNVNRPPKFGTKTYTDYSDFSGGTLNNTNITSQLGNITLESVGGAYVNGTYTSPAINIGANSDKLNFTYISWISNLPSGTNITLLTRTASTSAGLSSSSWSSSYTNSTRSIINSTNNQYIQFMANLTTTDNTKTPVLQEVDINYEIATPTLLEDYVYESWIDLDNYFEELDTDDNLIFNHTDASNVNIAIDQDYHTVRLSFDSNWYGTRTFRFLANDSYSVVYSNNLTITIQDVTDDTSTITIISSGGGGGGGGAIQTKIKKVPQYEYTRLLIPGQVSLIEPFKVKIPIIVENNVNTPLKDIYLSATAEEGVSLEFDTSFIDKIDLNDKKTVNLFATAVNKNEPYTIVVNAKVVTPSLNDSTIIQINPLENLIVQVKSVMDLLKTHPECLELNELVVNARKAIENKEYAKANNLLDEALRSCRFILAKEKEGKIEEKPSPKTGIIALIISVLITTAALISFYLAKRKK